MTPAPRSTSEPPTRCPAAAGRFARWCLAALAAVCFAVGWVGVFVPVLPTTVFWLLAVLLAGKACPVLRRWVYRQGPAGHAVHDIVELRGLTRPAKRHALIGMWATLALSCGAVLLTVPAERAWLATLPALAGLGVTAYIVRGLKTLTPESVHAARIA